MEGSIASDVGLGGGASSVTGKPELVPHPITIKRVAGGGFGGGGNRVKAIMKAASADPCQANHRLN